GQGDRGGGGAARARRVVKQEYLYGTLAAGANVLGALAVVSRARWSVRALDAMIAIGAGFITGVVVVEIFPEAIARGGANAAIVALAGYMLVHLTQHTLVK